MTWWYRFWPILQDEPVHCDASPRATKKILARAPAEADAFSVLTGPA